MKTKMKTAVSPSPVSYTMILEKIESQVSQSSNYREEAGSFNSSEEDESLNRVKRLYELGLRPGLQIQIIGKVSFNSVTIIQFGQTRLALNEQEMSCLHGRS